MFYYYCHYFIVFKKKKKVSTKENKLEPFFILIYEALNLTLATTQHEQPDLL